MDVRFSFLLPEREDEVLRVLRQMVEDDAPTCVRWDGFLVAELDSQAAAGPHQVLLTVKLLAVALTSQLRRVCIQCCAAADRERSPSTSTTPCWSALWQARAGLRSGSIRSTRSTVASLRPAYDDCRVFINTHGGRMKDLGSVLPSMAGTLP
jgi:hypothetical protein